MMVNISNILRDEGLYIYEEVGRFYMICVIAGYKEVLPEAISRIRLS